MSLAARLRAFFIGSGKAREPLPSRRERQEAARERHHATGEPEWSDADRHLGPAGRREVQDLTPGWLGEQASHRVIDE